MLAHWRSRCSVYDDNLIPVEQHTEGLQNLLLDVGMLRMYSRIRISISSEVLVSTDRQPAAERSM